MWLLYLLSWIASIVHLALLFISIASALFYASELVEEYTSYAERIIRWIILAVLPLHPLLYFVEDLPATICIVGFAAHVCYLMLMRNFPAFVPLSPNFIAACVLFLAQQYLSFGLVRHVPGDFYTVVAYMTICVWMSPLALLISLSANELTLPHTVDMSSVGAHYNFYEGIDQPWKKTGTDFIVGGARRRKKYSIKQLFSYLGELFLPQRQNRHYY